MLWTNSFPSRILNLQSIISFKTRILRKWKKKHVYWKIDCYVTLRSNTLAMYLKLSLADILSPEINQLLTSNWSLKKENVLCNFSFVLVLTSTHKIFLATKGNTFLFQINTEKLLNFLEIIVLGFLWHNLHHFPEKGASGTINYKIFNNNCNGSSLEAYPCFAPVTQIASHVLLNGNCRRLIRRADLSFQNFIKLSTVLSRIICSYISHKVKSTLLSMRMSHPFEY